MFFTTLETQRLILKNIEKEDNEFILEQFSNPIVNKYLFDCEPYQKIEEANELIDFYTQKEPRNQHRWILILKETGEKIGTCGFHIWNQKENSVEIGYDLNPNFWKKGYMKEALATILSFAKDNMKVIEIRACIYKDNEASIKLAKSFGFEYWKDYNEIYQSKPYLHSIYVLRF